MSLQLSLSLRLGGDALAKLASELVGRLATFGLSLLVANVLGERAFGTYNFALALGFVLAQIADMGLQVLMSRDVAISGRRAKPAVNGALRLKLLLSLPVLVLLIWLASGRAITERLAIVLLGLAMLAQTFLEFAAYIYRGQRKLLTEARLLTVARLLTAALAGAAIWTGAGLVGAGAAYALAVASVAAWALWRLAGAGWFRWRPFSAAPPPGMLLRQALPLGVAIFLSIGYTRLAIFLLEIRLGAMAVAQYSAAQRLVEPTQIVPAALLAAVFPAYSHALHHDKGQARRLGLATSSLLAAGGLTLAAIFWIGAPWLISRLYGDAFVESIAVLRVLGLSALPAYVNYSLTHMLIARGQQLYSSLYVAMMTIVHAWLSWHFIPAMGPMAPAISVTFAELTLLLFCAATLRLTEGKVTPGALQQES